MSNARTRTQRRAETELTFLQLLELLLGPSQYGSDFADDADREDAYWTHRERVLDMPCAVPSRPWAFWRYEYAPEPPPESDALATLARHGLLTDAEKAKVRHMATSPMRYVVATALEVLDACHA